jgi:hypothetical protein
MSDVACAYAKTSNAFVQLPPRPHKIGLEVVLLPRSCAREGV